VSNDSAALGAQAEEVGAVLVFLPGIGEIRKLCDLLEVR
jgi:HrpA-like RNA helicase